MMYRKIIRYNKRPNEVLRFLYFLKVSLDLRKDFNKSRKIEEQGCVWVLK